MATRRIVPRATGEGGLGKTSKRWGDSYFVNLHLGDGVGNTGAYLYAELGLGNTPALRYSLSNHEWQFSNDGVQYSAPWLKTENVVAERSGKFVYKNQHINANTGKIVIFQETGWEIANGTIDYAVDISFGVALNVTSGVGDVLFEGVYESAAITTTGKWYCDATGNLTQTVTELYVGYAFETGKLLLGVPVYTPAV